MERLGSKIVELHSLRKSYGEQTILDKFDYSFTKGERVGIIGKNGTGKSTFLNILTGQEALGWRKNCCGIYHQIWVLHPKRGFPLKKDKKLLRSFASLEITFH